MNKSWKDKVSRGVKKYYKGLTKKQKSERARNAAKIRWSRVSKEDRSAYARKIALLRK